MEPDELMIERAAYDTDYVDISKRITPEEEQAILDDLLYPLEEQYLAEQELYEQELLLEKGVTGHA
jgi:hypothetical protein